MSFGKYWNHVCKAKASKEQKWRLRCQDRGSLTNGATKLILSSYFITRLIITLLKTSARRIFGEWNYQATETWGRARRPREKLQVSQKKIPKIPTWWIFPRFATLSTAVTTTGWKFKVVGFGCFVSRRRGVVQFHYSFKRFWKSTGHNKVMLTTLINTFPFQLRAIEFQ